MLEIQHDYSLQKLNTFGLDIAAKEYIKYDSVDELKTILKQKNPFALPALILGGGSNLLFKEDFRGTVLHSFIKGIEVVEETTDEVLVRAGAGEEWDSLVQWAVDHTFYGLENLSLIPGHVGAAPVQNIGAYGVEIKDVFERAEGVWLASGEDFKIEASQMEFDYRHSIFKGDLKGKVILTHLFFRLKKKGVLHLDYGSVREAVKNLGETSLQNVREAIIQIRSSKLPDPSVLGNAGSFFKNPIISHAHFMKLKEQFSEIPYYLLSNSDQVKIPAGWLIQECGWKGKSLGEAAVHDKQALVLINKGGATGDDLIQLALQIENDVLSRFSIQLEKEVTVISSSI